MQAEIPVLSLVSAGLVLTPLVWYLRAHNIAAVAIGAWLSVTNIIYAVDALIWAGDPDFKAPLWCDICRFLLFITGSRIALPAACLCICIHLERLASFCQISTPAVTRRRISFECLMCFGLPVVYIVLHLIVQPRRFDLFDGFGCRPATYPAVATIFLVWIPPFLLAVATTLYAVTAWRHFLVHGVQFSRDGTRSLARNMYIRLIGMALLELGLSIALTTVTMWYTLSPGLAPLADMPRHLNQVLMWGPDAMTGTIETVLMVEWIGVVVQSAVFFGLFACRTGVLHQAWHIVRPFRELFRNRHGDAFLGQGIAIRSSTSTSARVLPITTLDFTAATNTSSTESRHGHSIEKSLPSTPNPPRPPSLAGEALEGAEIFVIDLALLPLESPSRSPAAASSHNSVESNFDPRQLVLPSYEWPQPPSSIPVRPPRRSSSMGYVPKQGGRFEVPFTGSVVYARSHNPDFFKSRPPRGHSQTRQTIYMAVVKESG
ncbi:hypothetical protein PAXRUDRAFT_780740 [Paxillus rubicundulus Ve08.2h10]|uniref:Uncharacterized protein n=1 Tax=Paxillus rubicundulus Ve08.2h10 TaxID=930991 RepID=A0A0D0DQT0_9AGAM|nr:hypothetical protein PAXRUDRAFT_780740 [Paxillus rubicundulus Ve08.2h10]